MTGPRRALQFVLTGRVQGVGFRPFVFRLAHEHGLAGHVRNLRGDVEIVAEGPAAALEAFAAALTRRAPPLARPLVRSQVPLAPADRTGFAIAPSSAELAPEVSVPPDFFACADCLAELADPHDRRHRYAFINCTQCGPRYTLIEALPYDRSNTSMAAFPLCERCRREYLDPLDRRFHAEPVACPACGPHLAFDPVDGPATTGDAAALLAATAALQAGRTIAVRGIGGYHLLCDARSETAVRGLRERKQRPDKPLAVMYPLEGRDGLDAVRREFALGAVEAAALADPMRAIVLLAPGPDCRLAPAIAPGLAEVGVFLPYSPLHALLLDGCGGPLVATSGNVSGEPVLTDPDAARRRLAGVAQAFLHHDRRIVRPADDSVLRVIGGRARPIRLGRGAAPLELELPRRLPEPVLAVGGHLKLTVALAWDRRVVVSPHIGDMGTLRSEHVFGQVVADLQRLYGVHAGRWLCDAHPGYTTTRWVRALGTAHQEVLHHHAHASGLLLEHGHDGDAIVFAWDGVGYGADGTLWGGETFVGRAGHWRRAASLRLFRLPGGELAGRAPWRSAAALCWEAGLELPFATPDPIVRQAWERGLNCPPSSAAGRLFDALAALVLGVREASFEGQAPMWLEARAGTAAPSASAGRPVLPVIPGPDGVRRIDWQPLVEWVLEAGSGRRREPAEAAAVVHSTLADAILQVAQDLRREHGVEVVGLTGGVFQNRRLTEDATARLAAAGFRVLLAERVPCNDGGLAFGQVAEFAARIH